MQENIHPILDKLISRADKQTLLNQRSLTFWLTGLSGSGKSTIALGVEKELHKLGFLSQVLDGDNIRSGINNNLSFTAEDRKENIRRIAEVSKLYINTGIITLNCFISPTIEIREQARSIIGTENFREIYIATPLEVCEERDVKGLYQKARAGAIKNFTGIDAPFEAPANADLVIPTTQQSVEESIQQLLRYMLPQIKL